MQGPGRDDAASPHPQVSRTPECARACSCGFSGNLSAGQVHVPWGGAPLIENAPKGFLGPHPSEGPCTQLKRPACAGASELSPNPLAARSLDLPLRGTDSLTVPTVQDSWQYSVKRLAQRKRRTTVSGDPGPDP